MFPFSKSLALATFSFCGIAHAALSPEEFSNPPIEARPSVLWTWLNGYVDHKQITRELEEMKAKGLRGAVIWDLGSIADPQKIIPAGPEFLGPESLKTIHHAMDEAERLGLELGLVASSSWNAGGTWIAPEDGSKALLWSELSVEGPREFSEVLPLPKQTTKLFQDVAVMAVPDLTDKSINSAETPLRLDPNLDSDGRLTWKVPAGKWRILRFVSNSTGEILNCPSPNSRGLVIDHLSADATNAHFTHMLDTLKQGRKDYGPLKMLMLDSYEVRPGTDWTPQFLKTFSGMNGYDPTPWLPVLAGWTIESKELSERFRHDYQKFVSDQMVENHFVRSRKLLNERGLQLLAEGGHGGHARVDPLKALGAADIPMGEFWNHRKNWVTKEAASAAHIYGKKFVNSESFTGWQNWQDGPAAYKRLFDIALCAGLNQVTFHTFAHNPPEAGLPGFAYHAGEHFNVNSTWWNQAGPMLADMSRACHLMQQGKFVADVCAYYGDDAPNLVPARRIAPTIDNPFPEGKCQHCGRDFPVDLRSLGLGYDYDYINEEVLLTRMKFQNGKLVLPDGMSYRMMVLPDRKAISLDALKKIGELVAAGATIVGPKPERSNSLSGYPDCDREVQELADQIWGTNAQQNFHNYGKGKVVWNTPFNEVLVSMGVERDFVAENIDNKDQHLDYIHRATEEEDIYFVSNSAMTREVVRCRFRVSADRVPSFWNSVDGSITPCHAYEVKDGFTYLTLDLAPASSIFVIFAKGEARDHLVEVLSPTNAQMEIAALEKSQVQFHAWQAGTYAFKTTSGRSGKAVVNEVPATQPIAGPWKITFLPQLGAPESIIMETLADWTIHPNKGVQYFSGTATYHQSFTLTEKLANGKSPLMLDLGTVKEVAVVRVNGQEAGVLWKQPYQIDIARFVKAGENQLEIAVVNTWNNRIVGDLRSDPKDRITRTNLTNKFNPKMPLLSSGLLGPVVLKTPALITTELK
jgi:alpha-L-rhamnosidase